MDKKVAIIILCYNGSDYIGDCLSSIEKINYPKELFEIVVVDNASTDGSAEWLKARSVEQKNAGKHCPKLKVIFSSDNLGFTGGNNLGLQYAIDQGLDYAYLLNQDTEVDPDFLKEAIKVAESDKNFGAVQSRLMLFNKKSLINSIGNEIHYLGFAYAGGHGAPWQADNSKLKIAREITYASGAATLLRIKTLKKIGLLYGEYFMYHEDVDLGWQMWLAGQKVVVAPASVVYHKYDFSRSIKKYYFMERNRYIVILQNYKLATLILILPALLLMNLALFFYSFIGGWQTELFRVYSYFLKPKNWQKLFARRKEVQNKRIVADKKIIGRFVGEIKFQELSNPLLKYVANPLFNFYWRIVKKIVIW